MSWDTEWKKRIKADGSVSCNEQKKAIIINELWMRPHLIKALKLEIGCGPCMHIRALRDVCAEWGKNYTGIDMSKYAIESAKKEGLSVFEVSIFTEPDLSIDYTRGGPFDAFFLFDVLEHLDDHELVAYHIKKICAAQFTILINIPLYLSVGEAFERPVNIHDVKKFLDDCGVKDFTHKIYGINGLPYMFVEGFKK